MARTSATGGFEALVADAVSRFGAAVKPRLRGPGEPEDQLRGPTENLLKEAAAGLGLHAVLHGEVRLVDLRARPDYAVSVASATVGYIEIKRPGKGAEPQRFSGHDASQWQKLRLLPNVLYSDGAEFALYRGGERVGRVARLHGKLSEAGPRLRPEDHELARLLKDFLYWAPEAPRRSANLSMRSLGYAACCEPRSGPHSSLRPTVSGHRF